MNIITFSSCLHTDKANTLFFDEVIESSNSITASSDTCYYNIRQFPNSPRKLRFDLAPNNTLIVPHNGCGPIAEPTRE